MWLRGLEQFRDRAEFEHAAKDHGSVKKGKWEDMEREVITVNKTMVQRLYL
jgi:hypothetical protein